MTTDARTTMAQVWLDERRRNAEQAQALIDATLANYRPKGLASLTVGLPVPTVGEAAYTEVPFPCVLTTAALLVDLPGTLTVDVLRAPSLGNFLIDDYVSLTGGLGVVLPPLVRAVKVPITVPEWSPVLIPGAILVVTILECTGPTNASLCLTVRRT